jgi:chemotaxis protein histidine kinase CheA
MASDFSQIDPAMLELFQAEMDTHVPALNEGLLALEKGQAGGREIEGMMRAAHSIKGAARIVGIEPAVRVAHAMEDCFTAAKQDRIALTSEAVDVLLVGVDALQRICSPSTGEPVREPALAELLAQLAQLKSGSPPQPAAKPASTVLAPVEIQSQGPSVTLPSSFSDETCESLRSELLATIESGAGRIRLDFARVGELNATALAMLASFAREVAQTQPAPTIELCRIAPAVRMVLGVAGLDEVFGVGR